MRRGFVDYTKYTSQFLSTGTSIIFEHGIMTKRKMQGIVKKISAYGVDVTDENMSSRVVKWEEIKAIMIPPGTKIKKPKGITKDIVQVITREYTPIEIILGKLEVKYPDALIKKNTVIASLYTLTKKGLLKSDIVNGNRQWRLA